MFSSILPYLSFATDQVIVASSCPSIYASVGNVTSTPYSFFSNCFCNAIITAWTVLASFNTGSYESVVITSLPSVPGWSSERS